MVVPEVSSSVVVPVASSTLVVPVSSSSVHVTPFTEVVSVASSLLFDCVASSSSAMEMYLKLFYGGVIGSVARKKLPNVHKSCPKMISIEK